MDEKVQDVLDANLDRFIVEQREEASDETPAESMEALRLRFQAGKNQLNEEVKATAERIMRRSPVIQRMKP